MGQKDPSKYSRSRSTSRDRDHSQRNKIRRDSHVYDKHKRRSSSSSISRNKRNSHKRSTSPNRSHRTNNEKLRENINLNDSDFWSENEDEVDCVCYLVGVPIECNEKIVKDSLFMQGLPIPNKMVWKEWEGLDYMKCVFAVKEETEMLLDQVVKVNNTPIVVIPKIHNKSPLEFLVHHQLRIQSLAGPVESKNISDFLLKFGQIADFLILDSQIHPTSFLVTFAIVSSKRLLAGYAQNNFIVISDNGSEKKLKLEMNIKPALVARKKTFLGDSASGNIPMKNSIIPNHMNNLFPNSSYSSK
jgi:hypothetical protein